MFVCDNAYNQYSIWRSAKMHCDMITHTVAHGNKNNHMCKNNIRYPNLMTQLLK